jgi:hypothetical protein
LASRAKQVRMALAVIPQMRFGIHGSLLPPSGRGGGRASSGRPITRRVRARHAELESVGERAPPLAGKQVFLRPQHVKARSGFEPLYEALQASA